MKPTLFKTLQFVVTNLGLGTLRLKQVDSGDSAEKVDSYAASEAVAGVAPLEAAPAEEEEIPIPLFLSSNTGKTQPPTSATSANGGSTGGCFGLSSIPLAERKAQTVELLVEQMTASGPEWDQTRSFSLQLARLARGTGLNSPGETTSAEKESPAEPEESASKVRTLAVGFPVAQQNRLKQDFAGRFDSELEFVTLDGVPERKREASEAALILINIASVTVTKRLARQFLELLDAGRPTLFTGSRTALKSLGVLTNRSTAGWDYVPVPWDRDELIWRLQRLTQWEPLAISAPVPRRRPAGSATKARALLTSAEPVSQAC